MKTIALINVAIFAIFLNHASAQTSSVRVNLNSGWEFHKVGTNQWHSANVPGCVHTDLLANQLIPDPFFGENESKLQWIDKYSWEYKTVFNVDESILQKQNIELDFKGLDTFAEVNLNGNHILSSDNMFSEWQVDVKKYLKKGENTLRVLFHSPIVMGLLSRDKFNLEAPFGYNFEFLTGDWPNAAPYTRKAAYMYGWDWGPKLTTSGIWRPVYLNAWDQARISGLDIVQKEVTGENAELTVVADFDASENVDGVLNLFYTIDRNKKELLSRPVSLQPGKNAISAETAIKNPELWWPNGLGGQPIYKFSAELVVKGNVVANKTTNTGIRSVKLVQEPREDGDKSFYFEVNGYPVFAKGANYIPSDIFPSRVTPEHYEEIIKAAADANMNMLRVWGGGIYESDIFYDLCDKYGIMIWQDFAFAIYHMPDYPEFYKSIKKELKDNIQRLRNHPSIVLWCGNNETEMIWDLLMKKFFGYEIDMEDNVLAKLIPFPVSGDVDPAVTARVEKAYDDVFYKFIPEAIKEFDYDSHDYWPSSPMGGWKKPITNSEPLSGDLHFYVAMLDLPFSAYLETHSRFFSEHGFHAWPDKKTVYEFTKPKDRQIDSPVMKAHNKELHGNQLITKYILKYYREPKDFDSYLYLSQVLQAEGMKLALETHRRWMPNTMGTLYWQINDVWPGATWASLDYKNNPKALHYFAKKAFEPIVVIPSNYKNKLKVNIVTDRMEPFKARLEMKLINFNGKELWSESKSVDVGSNVSEVVFKANTDEFLKNANTSKVVFLVELKKRKKFVAKNRLYFTEPKNFELEKPNISREIERTSTGYSITLSSSTLVKNLYFDYDGEGKFSDNYFDLIPGEKITVEFTPENEPEDFEKKLKLYSLIDSY